MHGMCLLNEVLAYCQFKLILIVVVLCCCGIKFHKSSLLWELEIMDTYQVFKWPWEVLRYPDGHGEPRCYGSPDANRISCFDVLCLLEGPTTPQLCSLRQATHTDSQCFNYSSQKEGKCSVRLTGNTVIAEKTLDYQTKPLYLIDEETGKQVI